MDCTPTRAIARRRARLLAGLLVCFAVLAIVEPAHAIPTFARKYRTSCVTCHKAFPVLNNVGEAFRRNGYQFPTGDELLVRDEPIPFGRDAYKEMFPNTIWPSDMPHLPPIFIRAQQRMIFNTDPGPGGVKWDQDFPSELGLGGAGTFGRDISAWWSVGFDPAEEEVGVERVFVQFSNLFAWDPDEDDDGMHEGNRWFTLPKYAMNLRLGKMEPQVVNHVLSQHSRLNIQQGLPLRQTIGNNNFRFEPVQSAAVELHGVINQRNSYVIGFANGGNVSSGQLEDNNNKDIYFRVSRKWFGYPLDGVIGSSESVNSDGGEAAPAQDAGEDDALYSMPGLDYWRAWDLETGLFGWYGVSRLTDLGVNRNDYFNRIGADVRLQWFNWDIYGMAYWGNDSFAGRLGGVDLGGEQFFSYSIQSDYYWKPWIVSFLRYEQTDFREAARTSMEEGRVVPGMVFIIRQNMKLQTEWVIDTTGKDTGGGQATDQILVQLDYAY